MFVLFDYLLIYKVFFSIFYHFNVLIKFTTIMKQCITMLIREWHPPLYILTCLIV